MSRVYIRSTSQTRKMGGSRIDDKGAKSSVPPKAPKVQARPANSIAKK